MNTDWLVTHSLHSWLLLFLIPVARFIFEKIDIESKRSTRLETLYALKDILYMSWLCPAIFAMHALARNIKIIDNKKPVIIIYLFGILYTIIQIGIVIYFYWLFHFHPYSYGFLLLFLTVQVPALLVVCLLWRFYIGGNIVGTKPCFLYIIFGLLAAIGGYLLIGYLLHGYILFQ